MIRCFLPKDVGMVCTKIPGAWVHNKKQNINDNISFVPSSHCYFFFFHLSIISLGPSPSVTSFFDIWPPAKQRQVLFCFVLHLKSTVSLNLTFTSRDPDSTGAPWTSFGLKRALMSLSWEPSSTSSSSQLSLWKRASPPSLWASVSAWWAKISCSSGDFSGPVIFCSIICPHHILSKLDGSPHFLGEQTQVQKYGPD